jgi:hypothetical protein
MCDLIEASVTPLFFRGMEKALYEDEELEVLLVEVVLFREMPNSLEI